MKYSAKITQDQYVGKIRISGKGGDLTDAQIDEIREDKYGQQLIEKGILKFLTEKI